MSNTDPNDVILNKAWAMLWDPTSKYYLPNVLKNGGDFGTTHIPPLQNLSLDDMNSIPLYQSSTWGNVEISLSAMNLAGIPQVNNNGFVPDSAEGVISGGISFTMLDLSGHYEVIGSGLVGCGMTMAEILGIKTSAIEGQELDDDSNMNLARDYRDQLVNQGSNGATLVSTYYDQNDAMNNILNEANPFTAAWPNATPAGGGLNTKYWMGTTNAAGQNPNDSAYSVGGTDYNTHAYYMQTTLLGVALNKAGGSKDPENPYYSLSQSIVDFKGNTLPNDQSQTVGNVMNTVQTAVPKVGLAAEELLASGEHEVARKAREMAEADFPMWEKKAEAMKAAQELSATTYKSSGDFDFDFPMPTIAFDGTVKVAGISPNITMTTTVTKLTAAIPEIDINLLSGSDPNFTADAQKKIHDATWFQQNIGVKVNAALNKQDLLDKISGVMNQALKELLPS